MKGKKNLIKRVDNRKNYEAPVKKEYLIGLDKVGEKRKIDDSVNVLTPTTGNGGFLQRSKKNKYFDNDQNSSNKSEFKPKYDDELNFLKIDKHYQFKNVEEIKKNLKTYMKEYEEYDNNM